MRDTNFQVRKIKVKWSINEPSEQREAGVAKGERSEIRG